MPNTPAAAPAVSSTVGLKNMVIAPVTEDTETSTTYGDLQRVAGAIEATITPENNDPDIQYFDDVEGDVLYPDPELTFKTKLADLPLIVQEMIFSNKIDDNGVLIRTANDKPGYFAVGFMSEKANGTYRYVWLFKVRAKPVTETYATKEGTSITRQTGEVDWTAIRHQSRQRLFRTGHYGVRLRRDYPHGGHDYCGTGRHHGQHYAGQPAHGSL